MANSKKDLSMVYVIAAIMGGRALSKTYSHEFADALSFFKERILPLIVILAVILLVVVV